MAVAGDMMVHLKQGSSKPKWVGVGGRVALTWPKTVHRSGTGGTEAAPDMKRSVDMEVIDGAGGRISG